MKKTLFIELFQPYAQYRNPFTFYYAQTFPLPPKSTVIGMLQNATNNYYKEEFWDLKVSIHGRFEAVYWNYQQLIKGKVSLKGKERAFLFAENDRRFIYGKSLRHQRTPIPQQELFNGKLFIFLMGDERLLEEIRQAMLEPKKIFYLGRSEDVAFPKECKFVTGKKEKPANASIGIFMPTYIVQKTKDRQGVVVAKDRYPTYYIPEKHVLVNNGEATKNKAEIKEETTRETKFVKVVYAQERSFLPIKEAVETEIFSVDGRSIRIVKEGGWL